MGWHEEIDELHRFFEAWFLGADGAEGTDSMARVEAALHRDFEIVGPDGGITDRAGTLDMIRAGRGHTSSLTITTRDHRLLRATDELIVASYVEHHRLTASTNERLSTVVFTVDPDGPNGLRWLRVHETWLGRDNPTG